jgi:hypothetical protein
LGHWFNLPGAAFELQNDSTLVGVSGATFYNQGQFSKLAGSGTNTVSAPFPNSGTVEVDTGTVHFSGTYTHSEGVISLAGGTFSTLQGVSLNSGRLQGWGTVRASVTNAATVSLASSNGLLRIVGDYTQLLGGALELGLGGTSPGTNSSWLNVTGKATLNGSILVTAADGYLPEVGDSFQVITCASRTNDFRCFSGFLLLGHDRRLETVYTPTNLTLRTVAAPDPTGPSLSIIKEETALVCWPAEFLGYVLQSSTNLALTNWANVPVTETNRVFVQPTLSEEYFRMIKP